MKTSKVLLTFVLFLIFQRIYSQSNTNHPTISSAKVAYKSAPQATNNLVVNTTGFNINIIPQATVNLVPGANVSIIYFKIIDPTSNAIMYQASYPVNSPTILNNLGVKLFENTSGNIFISNGQSLSLKPYLFQITTEDNQQNMSQIFLSNQ